ncbi:peptide deformylase, mitochondrial-like [Diprion similis]|uniref:peptide deformylase, mitochondrial-like n=1 Tax=Diprion similis TaxID=362088 RepID=UPI001EF92AD3|nr:peptide deformylase, mitochondrial-like [Diprion similis]
MAPAARVHPLIFRRLIFGNNEVRRNLSFRKVKQVCQTLLGRNPVHPPYHHICQVGDPVLRACASPVDPEIITEKVFQKLLDHMKVVMRHYHAAGLAAPQVGVSLQIFIAEVTKKQLEAYDADTIRVREMKPFPLQVFINPTLKVRDYSVLKFPEGCESIRGFDAEVPRSRAVTVSGLDATGKPSTWEATGWAARIAQHEMDHLGGALYVDKMDPSTFTCTAWQKINENCGRIELRYYNRKM